MTNESGQSESEQDVDKVRDVHVWMRSLGDDEKRVMHAFPPCCHVQSAPGRQHYVPDDGQTAMLIGYAVSATGHTVQSLIVAGEANVRGEPVMLKTYVALDAVTVAAFGVDMCDRQITPAYVAAVLTAPDIDAAEIAVQALQVQA